MRRYFRDDSVGKAPRALARGIRARPSGYNARPMHPMLNIAVKAARRAGSIIERSAVSGVALDVRAKQRNDFVTQVDRAAEQAVIDVVRKAYPDHAILAEESGELPGASAEYCWVIDPLD